MSIANTYIVEVGYCVYIDMDVACLRMDGSVRLGAVAFVDFGLAVNSWSI